MDFTALHMKDCKPRLDGTPAVFHAFRVGIILASFRFSPTTIAAGILHDLLEDGTATDDQLLHAFGPGVATLVRALTHDPGDSDEQILERVKAGGIYAMAIKLADNTDNIRTIECFELEKRKWYLEYAQKIQKQGREMLNIHPIVDWHEQELFRASKKL